MSNNVAHLPDLYTITLTLSHMWERDEALFVTGGFHVPGTSLLCFSPPAVGSALASGYALRANPTYWWYQARLRLICS